ncbi:c-type cytochrome [Simplicispira suum]|uniref:SorU family sulfite dehydrogenase c-type cytochrome subunit n=1 Tax=Simplicispira suum TaxID=2109915 RepID=UPI003B5C670F
MTPLFFLAVHRSFPCLVRTTAMPLLAFAAAIVLATPAIAADDAAQMTLGKQLFISGTAPSCAVCHTLQDAGTEGAIGPILDDLKPTAARVKKAVMEGVGVMPSFAQKLTAAQIDALALYVSRASGGSH